MALFSKTNEARTLQAKTLYEYLTDGSTGSFYLMVSEGVAYSGGDTVPDDLSVTESATVSDIQNPLFFKKIGSAGNSKVQYVKPDASGDVTIFSQTYSVVADADIFTDGVRHLYIDCLITTNEIAVSDTVRGFALVADLYLPGSVLATGSSYLASEVDLTDTSGNRLVYLENVEKYERVSTSDGELFRTILSI